MKPKRRPMHGALELYSHGQVIKLMKNYLKILVQYRAPYEKPSMGDLKICFLNFSRLVWKLLSLVNTAKNLNKELSSENPIENMNTIRVINPSKKLEVKDLISFVLTSS
jgi:hypothetical protein